MVSKTTRDAAILKPLDAQGLEERKERLKHEAHLQLVNGQSQFDDETLRLFGLDEHDDAKDSAPDHKDGKKNIDSTCDKRNSKLLRDFKIEDLDYGLGYTNATYYITNQPGKQDKMDEATDESKRLAVIRMYSQSLNGLLDRDLEKNVIERAFNLNIGPRLLFSSSKALCTEYINSFTLSLDEIVKPNALKLVIQTIAIFNAHTQIEKESNSMFSKMRKYIRNFGTETYSIGEKEFSLKRISETIDFLEKVDAKLFTKDKFDFVIIHGDTNPTNLLFSGFDTKNLDSCENFDEFVDRGAKCYLVDYELWFYAANVYEIALFLYLICGFPRQYPEQYLKDKDLLHELIRVYITTYSKNRNKQGLQVDNEVTDSDIQMYIKHIPYATLIFSYQTFLFQSLFYLSKKSNINANLTVVAENRSYEALYDELFGNKSFEDALESLETQ
ncbi:MAG: hypothetical protein MHMPM18_000658 [Marteilia pararefringens]